MVAMMALWLPVLLSAILVFLVSFIIHSLLRFHRGDFAGVPGEANVMAAMRAENVRPGDYFFPFAESQSEMRSEAMVMKMKEGPIGFLTIMPSGEMGMGAQLVQWFIYAVLVGFAVAYVTGRTLAPGTEYLQVFRVSGTVAFLTYAGALPIGSIWFKRKWGATVRHMIDGLVYALLTAGCFGWLWPQ